jgi:hypothetical protein
MAVDFGFDLRISFTVTLSASPSLSLLLYLCLSEPNREKLARSAYATRSAVAEETLRVGPSGADRVREREREIEREREREIRVCFAVQADSRS